MQHTGKVKWFDRSKGYGFITDSTKEEDDNVEDIFVHHQDIHTTNEQFRYLVEGEYVQFTLSNTVNGRVSATDVRGPNGDVLMCETINSRWQSRSDNDNTTRPSRQSKQTRPARNTSREGMVWAHVPVSALEQSTDSAPQGKVKVLVSAKEFSQNRRRRQVHT